MALRSSNPELGEASGLTAPSRHAAARAVRAARAAFFAKASTVTPYIAANVGDEVFLAAADDRGPGREIVVKQRSKDMAVLKRAIFSLAEAGLRMPRNPVFVDVGANIGTTTVFALRRHGFTSGVALEPSPENFRVLRMNLIANDLDAQVQAFQLAVSDRKRRVLFDASDAKRGRHHIVQAAQNLDARRERLVVQATTIDALVADGVIDPDRVGLLWVDAARHEANILAAAKTLLEAGVPIVTALHPNAGQPARSSSEPWASVLPLLSAYYTDMLDLRKKDRRKRHRSIDDLSDLVDSIGTTHDVLLLRR